MSHCTWLMTGPSSVAGSRGSPTTRPAPTRPCDVRGLVVQFAGHQHPRRRVAGLAAVAEALAHALRDGALQHAGIQDDVRRLAAELLVHALDAVRRRLRHGDAAAGGAGEGHHVHVGMRGDRLADVGPSPLTRLNTPAGTPASCRISANTMPDNGAISLGLSTIVHPAPSAGATLQAIWLMGQFQGVMRPQTPTGSRASRMRPAILDEGIVLQDRLHRRHVRRAEPGLGALRERERRAELGGDRLRHVVETAAVDFHYPADEFAPFGDAGAGERGKRAASRRYGTVDVGGAAERNRRGGLLRRRVDDREILAPDRVHPRAVDIELAVVVHAALHRAPAAVWRIDPVIVLCRAACGGPGPGRRNNLLQQAGTLRGIVAGPEHSQH